MFRGKCINRLSKRENSEKGEVFYLRPTVDFTVEACNHYVLYYFIDLDKLRRNLNKQCICQRGEIVKEKAPGIIKGYIDEIKQIRHIEMDSFLEYADTKGKLLNYLTWLIKLRLDKSCEADKTQCEICYINRAKKIIIDNLERQVTVKEISEKLGVSIYILQKNFKQVKGTTVYDYIRRMKINNSKILLKETSDSIIEISHKTGYENPSKFSAAFKNITGYTPTEYRRL